MTMMQVVRGWMMGWMLLSGAAYAAQFGRIVVSSAEVHEFPQSGSKVIGTIEQDQQVAVSNFPTEGFYKVRMKSGELGWVSGNDVYVWKPGEGEGAGSNAPPPAKAKDEAVETAADSEAKILKRPDEREFRKDHSRILIFGGVQYPSNGGLKDVFVTDGITPGKGGGMEFQFQWTGNLYFAARAQYRTASLPLKAVSGTSYQQELTQSSIPVEVGLNYTLFYFGNTRLSVGGYAGMAFASKTSVRQKTSSTDITNDYESSNPILRGSSQLSIGLSRRFGFLLEASYLMEKTGEFDGTSLNANKMAIDYSGPEFRAGLEWRF